MKPRLFSTVLLTLALAGASLIPASAQTNAPGSGIFGRLGSELDNSGLLSASNYSVSPYGTFARSAPKGQRWGGGILAVYNVNANVGMGLGVDYLGRFSMVSGNATLQLPIHPLQSFSVLPEVLRTVEVDPFVLAGVGRPMSGASTDVALIQDTGAYVKFGHWLGGRFAAGYAHGRWDNAGVYSGQRDHVFTTWMHGF